MPLTESTSRMSNDGAARRTDQSGCAQSTHKRHIQTDEPTDSPSSSPTGVDARLHVNTGSGSSVRRSLRLHVGVLSKRKGVLYNADGHVLACRFCEILRVRDEQFLYEDESLVVFRPLRPIVPSHILIVPRAHIRNVNQLTVDHVELVRRMRTVAEQVLHTLPKSSSHRQPRGKQSSNSHCHDHSGDSNDSSEGSEQDGSCCADEFPALTVTDLDDEHDQQQHHHHHQPASISSPMGFRFAFHVPPFNSIDHVHMHAFGGSTSYFGRIKYRTKSWWCRSYDEVMTRLEQL